jgi:hypothetical protein
VQDSKRRGISQAGIVREILAARYTRKRAA